MLPPETLESIASLELVARTVVSGFLAGVQRTEAGGPGVEFREHRAYQPGDDVRRIDWRASARSGRHLVRESDLDRSLTLRLVLDATASMAHEQEGALMKLDYARYLAAALAWLAHTQGDQVRVHAIKDSGSVEWAPGRDRRGTRGLAPLFAFLEGVRAGGRWPPAVVLLAQLAAERRRRRELVCVVSDLHQQADEQEAALEALAARHEVLVFHIVARDELELDYGRDVELEDLETGEVVRLDRARAKAVRARVASEYKALERRLLDRRIAYARVTTDEPLDRALAAYLDRPKRG